MFFFKKTFFLTLLVALISVPKYNFSSKSWKFLENSNENRLKIILLEKVSKKFLYFRVVVSRLYYIFLDSF